MNKRVFTVVIEGMRVKGKDARPSYISKWPWPCRKDAIQHILDVAKLGMRARIIIKIA